MGGGTVLRSAAAKVAGIGAGIGAVNAGLRGFPASANAAARQSLGRNAAAAHSPSATLSAQGVCEEAGTVTPDAVQWNQWNIDDWEEVMTVVEEGSGEPMPRVIFGGAPSLEETKAATNELKDAIDMVYLSKSEDKVIESGVDSAISTAASGAVTTYAMPNQAVQAFKLLSQSPAAQDVVASIASDPNVWNAFLQNDALKDYMRSQNSGIHFPLMDLKPEEYVGNSASGDWKSPTKLEEMSDESNSANHENGFITMLHNVKLTVVEMVSNVSSFIHNIFSPPAAEKAPADDASTGSIVNERTVGASLMGLVALVIMVVLLKRV